MSNRMKSPQTATAIGVAMELACASGHLEIAERFFECYRCLFAEYHTYHSTCVGSPLGDSALENAWPKVVWWQAAPLLNKTGLAGLLPPDRSSKI